ncbi:hypothetical protein TrRE_jg676, partial [Triparma retinervis]
SVDSVGSVDSVDSVGSVGNLLISRTVNSSIHTVTTSEYAALGSSSLLSTLSEKLESSGRKPYVIPVGGSNALGTFGYIEAAAELRLQWDSSPDLQTVTDVVVTCGSGGTAAGVAQGFKEFWPDHERPKIHAVGVCDSPGYFVGVVGGILTDMGFYPCLEDATAWVRGNV